MTRPLTAAEAAVEREWLLEHGRSAEEVERMQFADLTQRLLVDSISAIMSEDCGYCGRRFNDHRAECTECRPVKIAVLRVERLLSPPETPAATSMPHLPGETALTCSRARCDLPHGHSGSHHDARTDTRWGP